MKKTEFLIEDYHNIREESKGLDKKTNVLLIIYVLFFLLYFSMAKNFVFINININNFTVAQLKSVIAFIFEAGIIVLLLLQLYILIFQISGSAIRRGGSTSEKSIFTPEGIAEMGQEEFIRKVNEKSERSIDKELAEMVYEAGKTVRYRQKKFDLLIRLLFLSVAVFMLYLGFIFI
jgi:hypothetical protein